MDILVFHQAGTGGSVGIDQTVDTEVAIMGPFAAVAAVQVLCLAVLSATGIDCVVTPLPDETARFMCSTLMTGPVTGSES